MVLLGDVNGRVGTSEVAGIVGQWGVDGVNDSGKHRVDICAAAGLFFVNTFWHRLIHRCTWRSRDERSDQQSVINYIALDEKLGKNVLDAKVLRERFDRSEHYAALPKIKIRDRWECGWSNNNRKLSEMIDNERMERKEVRELHEGRVCETE